LAVRYEAHLTREVGRLLTQLEQARRCRRLALTTLPDRSRRRYRPAGRRARARGEVATPRRSVAAIAGTRG